MLLPDAGLPCTQLMLFLWEAPIFVVVPPW